MAVTKNKAIKKALTGKKRSRRNRECPESKKIKGTNYVVDAFSYKEHDHPVIFFLSHFHSDHYGGLIKSFSEGLIYCSFITAELVEQKFGLGEKYLRPLKYNERIKIDLKNPSPLVKTAEYSHVTLLEANHCPGSAMFLFEIPGRKPILHTGDFRFCSKMKEDEILSKWKGKIGTLYLDTTYCSPRYEFPTQEDCCEYVVSVIKKDLQNLNDSLYVIGTYTLGKENILEKVHKETDLKIAVEPYRMKVLEKIKLDWKIEKALTENKEEAKIFVVQLGKVNKTFLEALRKERGSKKVIGFKPTGWSGSFSVNKSRKIEIYNVPYSEHSSFSELKECVEFFEPKEIIPTVNNETQAKVKKMVKLLKN